MLGRDSENSIRWLFGKELRQFVLVILSQMTLPKTAKLSADFLHRFCPSVRVASSSAARRATKCSVCPHGASARLFGAAYIRPATAATDHDREEFYDDQQQIAAAASQDSYSLRWRVQPRCSFVRARMVTVSFVTTARARRSICEGWSRFMSSQIL